MLSLRSSSLRLFLSSSIPLSTGPTQRGYFTPAIPKGTDYTSVIEADIPIVVQHATGFATNANALITTIAYSVSD
jgi:hypothetical protein